MSNGAAEQLQVHILSVRALPDIRGLVCFASCSCGWRGDNHPSIPTVAQASQRANGDAEAHRQASSRT